MTCPKCKTEKQDGNFCGECGNRLRERCPECGEMEPIGRKICETLIVGAEEKEREHVWGRVYNYAFHRIIAYMILTLLIGCFWSDHYTKKLHPNALHADIILFVSMIAIVVAFFGACLILEIRYQRKREDRLLRSFSEKFPLEAEILKKAEGEEK